MPQVVVKFAGKKPVEITAGVGDSVGTIVARAFAEAFPGSSQPKAEELKVALDGKVIQKLSLTVGDLNIHDYKTLVVDLPVPKAVEKEDVALVKFKQFLRVSAGELGDGEVTFISVACFDNNHGRESIIRQQCPPRLLDYCVRNKIDLNLILVDPAFAEPSVRDYPQIYDLPGWRQLSEEEDGKVRQYTYTPAVSARACDVWLTVFAAPIPEFSMHLRDKGKVLGGVAVQELFALLAKPGMARSCLICGCFAFEEFDNTQYFTLGSRVVIEGTGFPVNP